MLRHMASIALVALAIAASSCGGGDTTKDTGALVSAQVAGGGGYLSRFTLQVRLGTAFRQGLYRLAVMSQPEDEAADNGQPLPTGKVGGVKCGPDGVQPAAPGARPWRCAVGWRTVSGAPRTTRYSVHLTSRSCYDAVAAPRFASVLDATIGAPAEHPLNTFGRSLGAC
ncbi:MAG: hypothetical protein QOG15_1460 [Solirubrobacteraceae bacterium]|jgi:hypothetical protein|nr:hypothetical protein [Solirubrobacteraceae bacterium]